MIERLAELGARVWACDPNKELVEAARAAAAKLALTTSIELGGVEALSMLETSSVDGLFALNVLAYLTDDEEALFYAEARRIVRPGGLLIATHSNELFDLYTLSRYTVEFFRQNFPLAGAAPDVSPLLANPTLPDRISFNVRENPLTYQYKLSRYGFQERRQEFANLHPRPPLLMDVENFDDLESRRYLATSDWPDEERWKLMFMCSMYGSRSERAD